jgi:hypothetical protein
MSLRPMPSPGGINPAPVPYNPAPGGTTPIKTQAMPTGYADPPSFRGSPHQTQIIGGSVYKQYTPEWYAAMAQNKVTNAATAGTAGKAALDALKGVSSSSGASSGANAGSGAGLPPRVGSGSGTGAGGGAGVGSGAGSVAPIQAPDLKASQDAELLRAKEKQGQIATSSLTGLREALGARQMLGSGAEGMATADVANEAAGNLSDLNVAQMKDSDESARRLAELSYNGAITQRGQDIGADVAYRGQDVTQRGQDIGSQNAAAALEYQQQQQILNALKGLVY